MAQLLQVRLQPQWQIIEDVHDEDWMVDNKKHQAHEGDTHQSRAISLIPAI